MSLPFALCRPSSVFRLLPFTWLWFVLINDLRVEWTVNPQYGYGWAVPFLCAFLIWQRVQGAHHRPLTTDHRLPTAEAPSSIFYLLFALCVALYAPTRLVQEANPGWRLVSWALAIEVVGLTLIFIRLALGAFPLASEVRSQKSVAGNQTSVLRPPFSSFVFPVCFFLVAVPWPSLIEQPLIQGLTRADTNVTAELLGWLGIPAMPHGNVIEVATGMVGIDEACSGIRSFQATLMISLFFGELYALSAVRRALLVLAGFALSFLFNLARTTLLTWVAAKKGVAAIATWHDPAGVTILVACFFCLWGMGVWLRGKRPREVGSLLEYGIDSTGQAISRASACEVENQTSRAKESGEKGTSNIQHPVTRRQTPVVGGQEAEAGTARSSRITHHASRITHPPSLALALALGTWLVISEVSVEAWYRSHETRVPVVAQWTVAWPVNNPVFKELPLPERTRQILRYDEGRSAAWEADGLQWQAVFLRWKPGRTAIHLAQNHTPEVCMTGAGHTLNVISPQEWFEVNGLRMPFLAYQVTDAPRPFFVFYCLWDDRASAQEFETMSLTYGNRLAPVLAGLRNPGQRSLEIAVAGSENAEQAKTVLRGELNKLIVSKP